MECDYPGLFSPEKYQCVPYTEAQCGIKQEPTAPCKSDALSSVTYIEVKQRKQYTGEFQWIEHRWLVFHGYFELVLESLGNIPQLQTLLYLGKFRVFFLFIY